MEGLSAEDVNVFLPAERRVIQGGTASVQLEVIRGREGRYDIKSDTRLADVAIRDQPDFLPPITGSLYAVAQYDQSSRLLSLNMARAHTNGVDGTLSGTVSFADALPRLDLTMTSSKLPLKDMVDHMIEDELDRYGNLDYLPGDNNTLTLRLTGASNDLTVAFNAATDGDRVFFVSENPQWPNASLRFGRVDIAWDSKRRTPEGQATILDGRVEYAKLGIVADHVSVSARFKDGIVDVAPLNAQLAGQPWIATVRYDIDKRAGEATVAGTLANLEKNRLASAIRNTELRGAANVNAHATFTQTGVAFDGDVDATQTEIAYRWFYRKPPGIGAMGHVRGEFIAKKRMSYEIDAKVAGSDLKATAKLTFDGAKWTLRSTEATSDHLDLVSVGKCLSIPYDVISGVGTGGRYEWTRVSEPGTEWRATMACASDEVGVRVKGEDQTMVCKGLVFSGGMTLGEASTGEITLTAKSAVMPPLRGSKWFVPFEYDETKFPPTDRRWVYHLAAENLDIPPWKGTGFRGEGYATLTDSALTSYSATIDGGIMQGSFHSNRIANAYEASNEWKEVPAHYFMEHLHLPIAFTGNMTGKVSYSQDRDDPRTLKGSGYFEMRKGQFSADFLISMLEQQMQDETAALPPSLRFSSLEADVDFVKDLVKTPSIKLVSDAIRLEGSGQFVTGGDMDYNIKVAVAPDTAERIPILRDSFNVEGHKLAQRDIDLAFRLTGPTVKPVSEVTETPSLHVTLVSGSLEAATEALRVIDLPRKILVDLLKTGGGILGAKRTPPQGNPN
jgi:hypothetical protein